MQTIKTHSVINKAILSPNGDGTHKWYAIDDNGGKMPLIDVVVDPDTNKDVTFEFDVLPPKKENAFIYKRVI